MEEKLRGIVLSSVNYGESDKILNIFTLEKGVVSAKIKGVKKAGAKLKFASEPFCFAEYVFSVSASKRIVINASLIDSFYSLREDIYRFYSGGAVLEFVKKFERENIVSSEMFLSCTKALKEIAYGENYLFALCEFFLVGLRLIGYGLNVKGCNKCGAVSNKIYLDCDQGGFLCEECKTKQSREINLSTFIALKQVDSGEVPDKNGLIGAIRLINFYIQNKIEEKNNSLSELINLQPK